MKTANRKFPQTPSEFYRERRPEYFSDSEKSYEVKLTKEHFAYELSLISTNQKQDAFETLCRRLAEKLIAPNLIPQVGPTGGGDGKTDTETYPVAEQIAERWFVPENGWQKGENWAFAISAKEDWQSKVKSDVKKIVETGRGYTKIYFITNQIVSSKKKKDEQDELKEKYKVDIIILDGEWIKEKIFSNDFIILAVDSLNLSTVYKNETIKVGKNDAARIQILEEIENKINDTNRYFECDYQLVEDALQSAILTRMLEKPKDEVIGKFDRALRLGQKLKNIQQLGRIYYQKAWTCIQWYDDYENFITEFEKFKECAIQDPTIHSLELYSTLVNLLRSLTVQGEKAPSIDIKKEEDLYKDVLEKCINDTSKPTRSLTARTYKSLLSVFRSRNVARDLSAALKELLVCFQESRSFLEYPFDSFKTLVEICGEFLPNNNDYDKLIDYIAEISESRASELASGETFFKRAVQKISKGYDKESLIYFGKSVKKLAKNESQDYLYFALMGLSQAYRNLGLLWASNSSILAASSITFKEWYNEGKLNKRLYRCAEEALKNELFLGRIPYLLSWHELFQVVLLHFEQEQPEEGELPTLVLVDACLSVRLLNSPYNTWSTFSFLPDILKGEKLWLSEDAALYMLGYTENIDSNSHQTASDSDSIDEHYSTIANQPFKSQIVYVTNLLNAGKIIFKSVILGTEFNVEFAKNKELAIYAECILAYLESFLATAFLEIFPSTEVITLILAWATDEEKHRIIEDASKKCYTILLSPNVAAIKETDSIGDLLLELVSKILSANFIIKEAKQYLEKLFAQEEVHERLSLIIPYKTFFKNVFGDNPKIFWEDWEKNSTLTEYPLKRGSNPLTIIPEAKENSTSRKAPNVENMKHTQTKVASIIDTHLWDKAHWKGVGFLNSPEVPMGVFLAFEDGHYGRQIFQDWIKRLGKIDKEEAIKITIIKGTSTEQPFWYKVHISKDIDKKNMKNGDFFVSASRFHEMTPDNDKNLKNLIAGVNYFKKFVLLPATFNKDGSIEPHFDLGITKTQLNIREAWQIGENDLDSVVINKNDNPIIPKDKLNAPVIDLLKKKKNVNKEFVISPS